MNTPAIRLVAKKFRFALALILSLLGSTGWTMWSDPASAQATAAVLVGAGDISSCSTDKDEATAALLDNIRGTVITLGDNAYPNGTLAEYKKCYGPTWGRHKNRTRPAVGNHEYNTEGAAGYYRYFGLAASPLQPNCLRNCKGYYSYNRGAWHIIVLNSEISMKPGSEQEKWLRADLKANQTACTLAYWHKPRFSSGNHGNFDETQPLWEALYDYGADVVLNGHEHIYERFAPQNPNGKAEPDRGIRQFIVGTGGARLYGFGKIKDNSEVRNNKSWGVLRLILYPTSYKWKFIPVAGNSFTDSGSGKCVQQTTVPNNLIFSDSFESGDFKAWSSSKSDGSDLDISQEAALAGSRGLQARIDDNSSIFLTDNSPLGESRYYTRYHFDPNSIKMASGNTHRVFQGYAGSSTLVLRVDFRFSDGKYQLQAALRNDGSGWKNSKWITIADASNHVKLEWQAATGLGANDGKLVLWINGDRKSILTGVDNDTRRIDGVRLGALAGIDSGTRGIYYFDDFGSWR